MYVQSLQMSVVCGVIELSASGDKDAGVAAPVVKIWLALDANVVSVSTYVPRRVGYFEGGNRPQASESGDAEKEAHGVASRQYHGSCCG